MTLNKYFYPLHTRQNYWILLIFYIHLKGVDPWEQDRYIQSHSLKNKLFKFAKC